MYINFTENLLRSLGQAHKGAMANLCEDHNLYKWPFAANVAVNVDAIESCCLQMPPYVMEVVWPQSEMIHRVALWHFTLIIATKLCNYLYS